MHTVLDRCRASSRGLLVGVAAILAVVLGAMPAQAKVDACGDVVPPPEVTAGVEARTKSLELVLEMVTGDLGECAGQGAKPLPGEGNPQLADLVGGHPESWASLAVYYFRPDDLARVICLIEHESNGDPNARNGSSGAAGLLQVMPSWAPVYGYSYEDLFRPEVSLWVGRRIMEEHGWDSWSPYGRGECQ